MLLVSPIFLHLHCISFCLSLCSSLQLLSLSSWLLLCQLHQGKGVRETLLIPARLSGTQPISPQSPLDTEQIFTGMHSLLCDPPAAQGLWPESFPPNATLAAFMPLKYTVLQPQCMHTLCCLHQKLNSFLLRPQGRGCLLEAFPGEPTLL